ncbi:MAG TPA: hypothetical protein VMW47_08145 [Verrucomicrobiae bacterium]|nr:hypothetical protein [Verrucomicrobiae bacterium]
MGTRTDGTTRTHVLRLERGRAEARLELDERRRACEAARPTVFLADLGREVLRILTL